MQVSKTCYSHQHNTPNIRSRGKQIVFFSRESWNKANWFPRDLKLIYKCFHYIFRLQRQQKNNWSESKQSIAWVLIRTHIYFSKPLNEWLTKYFPHITCIFSSTSCCFSSGITFKIVAFSLRLHVCVVVFIHEKENWQYFSRLLSHHFPPFLYPERGTVAQMYHDRDAFEFVQGHVSKNQPIAVFTWAKV